MAVVHGRGNRCRKKRGEFWYNVCLLGLLNATGWGVYKKIQIWDCQEDPEGSDTGCQA